MSFNMFTPKGGCMRRSILFGIAAFLIISCVGCNTIRGLGEDIGAVGGWMVKGSDKATELK